MSNIILDENGFIDLDELVINNESFKNIMQDGVVTNNELVEQNERVVKLLRQVERMCSEEQCLKIKELLAELCVLQVVYHYKDLQSLKY